VSSFPSDFTRTTFIIVSLIVVLYVSLPPGTTPRRHDNRDYLTDSLSQLPRSDDDVYARPLPIDKSVSCVCRRRRLHSSEFTTPPFSDDCGVVLAGVIAVVSVDNNNRLCFRC